MIRPMDHRLGVLAFGDSITHGGGELQWGVALQSWALWTARGLGLPFSGFAVDGATAGDVIREQLPRFADTAARPGARYDVGLLHIGANDVRTPGWDPAAYEVDVGEVLTCLQRRCDRRLVCTLPLDLGRPRVGAAVALAFGQVAIAARALDVLAADGMAVRVRPHTLIRWETTRWRRLRGDATYVYRQVKQAGRRALRG